MSEKCRHCGHIHHPHRSCVEVQQPAPAQPSAGLTAEQRAETIAEFFHFDDDRYAEIYHFSLTQLNEAIAAAVEEERDVWHSGMARAAIHLKEPVDVRGISIGKLCEMLREEAVEARDFEWWQALAPILTASGFVSTRANRHHKLRIPLERQLAAVRPCLSALAEYSYNGDDLIWYCAFCEASGSSNNVPNPIPHDANCPVLLARAAIAPPPSGEEG